MRRFLLNTFGLCVFVFHYSLSIIKDLKDALGGSAVPSVGKFALFPLSAYHLCNLLTQQLGILAHQFVGAHLHGLYVLGIQTFQPELILPQYNY